MTALTNEAKAIADRQPPHANLAAALVAALSELTVIAAGRTADAGSYKYDYADLGDLVKLTRPVLASHGLVALTPVHDHGTDLACTVKIIHTSGETLDLGPLTFPRGRDAQATGSMITYHRRYALGAALGMAVGEDDDGAKAQSAEPPFAWDAKAVQFQLRSLCGGDREKAKQVWSESKGEQYPPGPDAAAEILRDWTEHQPAGDG